MVFLCFQPIDTPNFKGWSTSTEDMRHRQQQAKCDKSERLSASRLYFDSTFKITTRGMPPCRGCGACLRHVGSQSIHRLWTNHGPRSYVCWRWGTKRWPVGSQTGMCWRLQDNGSWQKFERLPARRRKNVCLCLPWNIRRVDRRVINQTKTDMLWPSGEYHNLGGSTNTQ